MSLSQRLASLANPQNKALKFADLEVNKAYSIEEFSDHNIEFRGQEIHSLAVHILFSPTEGRRKLYLPKRFTVLRDELLSLNPYLKSTQPHVLIWKGTAGNSNSVLILPTDGN